MEEDCVIIWDERRLSLRRWVVERSFAWVVRNRRLSKDYAELEKTREAMVHTSMIQVMIRPIGAVIVAFPNRLLRTAGPRQPPMPTP
jgi:hypothetical protein